MIRVENLWHHYGVRPILRDVSFTVETGELVVLLGPNGMGKSTLLGCLAGVLWPQRGHVEFDGVRRRESIASERAIRQRVAYMPDESWIPGDMTGREYVVAVGRLYGIDDFRVFDHADKLLALFHLTDKQDALVSSYSTGQRKKIAIGSALITEAPYLLLDEPFSGGLDPAGILAVKRVLRSLADDQNVTVVMTTPVPEIIEELADRIAVLRDNTVIAYDSPTGLKRMAGEEKLDDALGCLMYPESVDGIANYLGSGFSQGGES